MIQDVELSNFIKGYEILHSMFAPPFTDRDEHMAARLTAQCRPSIVWAHSTQ